MTIEKIGQSVYRLGDGENYKNQAEAYEKIREGIYENLEIPEAVVKKIGNTTLVEGTLTKTVGNIRVTRSFYPTRDNPLYLLFEYISAQ